MRSLHLWVQLLVFLQLLGALSAGRLFERNHVPKDWVSLGRASPSSPVRFTVGLRAATVEAMADEFWAITTPTSPHYLDQLTREEVEQRFGASHEDRQLVQTWLSNAGVVDAQMRHVSSAIEVTATVDVVERLFNTEMRVFRHSQTRRKVIKAWGVASLPDDIHAGVDLVTGLSSFPVPPRKSHSPKVGQPAREQIIIPQSIRAFYQIRDQKPGSSAATQSVIEFGGQWFNNSDTALYAQLVGYTTSNTTIAPIPPEHVVGVNNPLEPGVESSLDVQMIAPTNLVSPTITNTSHNPPYPRCPPPPPTLCSPFPVLFPFCRRCKRGFGTTETVAGCTNSLSTCSTPPTHPKSTPSAMGYGKGCSASPIPWSVS